ncbi:MAG: hypothetical protein KDH94_01570 [Coxiellaceae bacterium]|nr:hypothetical protein [Coxiellaceae bacterium]
MNSYVTTTVANDLYRSRFYRVFPIYHHARTELLARSPVRRDVLTPEYQDYVSKLIRGKRVDTIVLITPGNIDFSGGQYYGSIWWARGYGVFNRSFMFMQTNTVFAAYDVYVIDAKTFRVLANASGSFQIRPHNVLIAWHKGYAGVTPQTLSIIRSVIRKKMPEYLTGLVHQTGLP